MAETTHPIELSAAETRALTRVCAAMMVSGLAPALVERFGEEHGVAYDSFMLKLAKVDDLFLVEAGHEISADDRLAQAAVQADVDQRRAALEEGS